MQRGLKEYLSFSVSRFLMKVIPFLLWWRAWFSLLGRVYILFVWYLLLLARSSSGQGSGPLEPLTRVRISPGLLFNYSRLALSSDTCACSCFYHTFFFVHAIRVIVVTALPFFSVNPVFVILGAGLFFLGRVADGDEVQRDNRSLDTKDFTYIFHPILVRMDSAPDGA